MIHRNRVNRLSRRSLSVAVFCAPGLTLLVPTIASAQVIGQSVSLATGTSGTLDGPAIFTWIAVTLVELAAIFWVGAQFWANFVLPSSSEKHPEEKALNSQVEERFTRRFSLPTLVLLLLAHFAVLYAQILPFTGNDWLAAFNWQLLSEHASNGTFGLYWLLRTGTILLALLVGLYMLLNKTQPRAINQALPVINLALGMLLFIAITLSSQATTISSALLPYAVVIDWLRLVAAALWLGGLLFILLVVVPLLQPRPLTERTRSLLTMLAHYTPLALIGAVLLVISSLLRASFPMASSNQLVSTAYGRTFLIEIVLLAALLVLSTYHTYWVRPRLQKEYQKYTYASARLEKMLVSRQNTALIADASASMQGASGLAEAPSRTQQTAITAEAQTNVQNASIQVSGPGVEHQAKGEKALAQQVKLREARLTKKATLMTHFLQWEPWLGVLVILCFGLMSVFASGLSLPATQTGSNTVAAGPFHGTMKTSDGKYSMKLSVTPNTFGTNVFTVQITDLATGQVLGAQGGNVTLFTTMLDMAMGTDSAVLQPDGKGGFSASGDLSMSGNWSVTIQLRTPDHVSHTTQFTFYTPF